MPSRNSLPNPEEIIKNSVNELIAYNKVINKISEEVKKLQHTELKAKFGNAGLVKTKATSAKAVLSKIPEAIRNSSQFVKDDDDIKKKNKDIIEKTSLEKVKKSKKIVKVTLSQDEFNYLKTEYIDQSKKIPQSEFDTFLYKNLKESFSFTNDLVFAADNPASKEKEPNLDLPSPSLEEPNATNENLTENNNSNEPVGEANPLTQEDVLKKLNELINKLKSPEFFPELINSQAIRNNKDGVPSKRATEQDIETQITGMKLKGGPADEPAFYDFYSLQIAFEHIWKELFDNSVENGLSDLYQSLVELEIKEPDLPVITPRKPFGNMRTFVIGALQMIEQEPDAAVLKAFSISKDIWNALTPNQTTTLTNISNIIVGFNEKISEITQAYESLFDGQGKIIKSVSKRNGGSGYKKGDKVKVAGGTGISTVVQVKDVNPGSGEVAEVEKITSGLYFIHPGTQNVPVSGGNGTGLTLDITYEEEISYDTIEETRTLYLKAKSYFGDQRLTLPLKAEGENIISYGLEKLKNKKTHYLTLHTILQQLEKRLKENYAFTIFAANEKEKSINFGIVLNYRQKWTPICYQAGQLVQTIPLAPKEVRKFSKKIVTKLSRSTKETSTSSEKRSLETSDNVKAEAEIMSKALKKVNSNVSARSSYSGWGGWSFGAEASYGKESTNESADNRKDFREAVVKAAQEYKNERSLEINSSDTSEFEAQESGEISNPNDEIPVTYLFYELQQRYQVNEKLHRITPVVLIAQEVPNPSDIDEDWIISYSWIIKKALLDDSFLPALYYLSNKIVGDEISLDELKKNMEIHRELVRKTTNEYVSIKEQLGSRYAALEKSVQRRIEAVDERSEGFFEKIIEDAFEQEDFAESVKVATLREEAAKDAYDRATREEKELRAAADREVTALQAATDSYTKALSEHLNRKTEIERLRIHIKDNILYYMQAIWSFEPQDQRFLRLYKEEVPDLHGELKYSFLREEEPQAPDLINKSYVFKVEFELKDREMSNANNTFSGLKYRSLVEIADLDTLLGFKGNYMIFPMKENNAITDYMMTPYLNRYTGLSEQDSTADWTLEDYHKYVESLKKAVLSGELSRELYEQELKPKLKKLYKKIITNPLRQNEEIVVPTGSLFIEALPGKHPILEDFKLMHRAIDVKKVQGEVRSAELENLRGALRLLVQQLEDPKIDKKIVIEGIEKSIVVNPES